MKGEKEHQERRVGYISWHKNLSGFIPPSGIVELSSECRCKWNESNHSFIVDDISDKRAIDYSTVI